jgi:hypothetical protein
VEVGIREQLGLRATPLSPPPDTSGNGGFLHES